MRRLASLITSGLLALSGCAPPAILLRAKPCLTGPVPQVGRPVPDEMFAFVRRERERAERASPLVRARILESIPSLFPDVSDLFPAPECHDELEREGIDSFAEQPLEFSRLLVARVRAVHDAEALMPLATRDEATITEYKLGPDEPGPPPPKSWLRYLALGNIPTYWVATNIKEGRRLMLARLVVSRDARELLLLDGVAEAVFESALFGHPKRAEGREAPALLASWLPDLRQRLQAPPDPAALELVIRRLSNVGTFAVRFGLEREGRALVNEVLTAKGELPITKGVPGAARDLAEVARRALHDLDTPQESVVGFDLPPPRRERFDPQADWLAEEPAGGHVSEADALGRVRDLDQELETLKYNAPRCYALNQLGTWLPPSEAVKRFDALLAPALDGEKIRLSTETLCRLRVALGLDGVDEARRVELLVRLLSTPPMPEGRDRSKDEHGPGIGWPAHDDPVRQTAARVLAEDLAWIERHPALRAWLERSALAPIPLESAPAETWSLLRPAFERTIDFHLSGVAEAKSETAQAILRRWIGAIREAESAKNISHIYVREVTHARVRALGDRARRAGLTEEVRTFLNERKDRTSIVAAYLLDL